MSVFEVCIKIFRKNLNTIIIYFIVFVLFSTIISIVLAPSPETRFGAEKINIAFIAHEETPLVDGIRTALYPIVNFIEITDDKKILQEALFFRRVHYILRIPQGFTESFFAGEQALLQKTAVPDSANAVYVDLRTERFLESVRLYAGILPEISLERAVGYALDDLSLAAEVGFAAEENNSGGQTILHRYFNFVAYSILFSIIFGVSSVLLSFNDVDRRRRNLVSPVPSAKISLQCYLACAAYALANWLAFLLIIYVFNFREPFNPSIWLFILNSFIFTLCSSAIAFLIGNLAKNTEIVNAVANVFTLGSSFLGGVFVPQELLGENVLLIASFLPSYWYVRANDKIAAIVDMAYANLNDIAISMLIQLGFTVAGIVLSIAIVKRRQTASQ